MASIISLIIIVTLSILIIRIATIALIHTGLSDTAAKFQARSAFTGVGFTTKEAESITEHPVRRKLIMLLMLLGNVGIISAVSSLIITFVDPSADRLSGYMSLLIITGSMLVLWLLSESKYLDRWLKMLISQALHRYTRLVIRDYNQLFNLSGNYEITELKVQQEDWLADRSLADLALKDEGIYVIGIHRSDGSYFGLPDGSSEVETGDTLVLYGREKQIRQLDTRKRDASGEQEHQSSSRKQESRKAREKAKDERRKALNESSN